MIFVLIFTAFLIVPEKSLCDPLVQFEEGVTEYFRTKSRPDYLEPSIREALQTSDKVEKDTRSCALCRIIAKIVIEWRRRGAQKDLIAHISKDLCTLFIDIGYVSCVGYIDITIDKFLYIIDNKRDITPERFCAIRLQENGCEDPNYVPWSVDLPPGRSLPLPKKSPGQKKNILHLTDIHYDPLYQPESDANCDAVLCCESTSGAPKSSNDGAGFWGDYGVCDMPWHSFEDLLNQIKKQHKQVDWVYFTGDIISHQVWNTSKESNQLYITKVLEKLQSAFGTTPVYPILGNHEAHPTDFYPPQSITGDFSIKWLFHYIAEEWSRWLPTSTLSTIRRGGFYTVLVKPGYRIIALNSNVCFTYNIGERSHASEMFCPLLHMPTVLFRTQFTVKISYGVNESLMWFRSSSHKNQAIWLKSWLVYDDVDPYHQLQWLSDTLLEAEKNQEAVHILSHVPPGDIECNQQWSHEFRRIIERFHNTITGQFNGHTHYDELKVFFNTSDKDDVINVAFNGGSFTTFVGLNPNYRIYTADENQGRILDYDQWTYNLSEANKYPHTNPKWYKLYSFKDMYGFEPSDLPQYGELVQNMSKDAGLLQNYHRLQVRNSTAALSKKCDKSCLRNLLCNIISVEYKDLVKCQEHKLPKVNDEL